MTGDQSAHVIWYLLASTLVLSSLASRKIRLRSVLGMALAWVAIFLLVLVAVSYRKVFMDVGIKVRTEVTGSATETVRGNSLHVRVGDDGHFWVDGSINGTPARFLIDSGATVTALSDSLAQKAGLDIDMDGPGVAMQTANGLVLARRSSIAGLVVGPIRASDLPIVVSDRFGDVNVLGMNFLSRLKSWRVENGEMVMEP